jgi:hypothetical protein
MTQSAPDLSNTDGYRWLVSEDSAGLFPIRSGTAESEAHAWTVAFAAGRDALLEGRIRYLAIAVDDEIPTFGYSPGRDPHGHLDPSRVVECLSGLLLDILRSLSCARPARRRRVVRFGGDAGWVVGA